ncbi:MAG: M23 family metallopeptidase [Clostridiales bacterium]|nr:M23 family metallopeptidase [Clostridiales bacterium]
MHPILKIKKFHTGIDIAAPTGTSVVAANAGSVIKAGWNDSYGYMVMIDHGGGIVTLYAHNSSLLVKTGDIVVTGDKIAKSGSTGMSTGPHVHFEVRKNGSYVDPIGWVKP